MQQTVQPYSRTETSVQGYSQTGVSSDTAAPEPGKPSKHLSRKEKARLAREEAAAAAAQPTPAPVKHILLVPVDRDNGHGLPVSVYKEYHYSD